MSLSFSWPLFNKLPIIGIIRGLSVEEIFQIIPLYRQSGLTTLEITLNTPDACSIITHALQQESEGLNIGAGTVCSEADLNRALSAGAQFIVSPILDKRIVQACVSANVPVFPGAFTPTEIYQAWSWGASMVKVYPVTSMGPGYIADLKAPLNELKLLPTGGITLSNMESYVEAGADGFGIGSQLFDKKYIKRRDWTGMKNHFNQFTHVLKVKANGAN